MMKRRIYLAAMIVAVFSLGACSSSEKKDAGNQTDNEKPSVKLETVTEREVPQIEEYTAIVEADIKNNIAPSSPVRIDKILVEVGDHVKAGQKLVQMDASGLQQSKLQLDNQKIEFKRTDELYKVGGVSKSEWDAVKTNLDVLQTAYNNLLENTQLLSPINGVITARNYDDGDMYNAAQPVLTVEKISPVKLLINVSEPYFPQVKKGSKAMIRFDAFGDEEFAGYVSLVYPSIDSDTHTFPVEISLANVDQRVRPGMFGRVTLDFGNKSRVVVPDMSIVKQAGSGERYVFVYRDGKVYRQVVELGRRINTEYELISGVENNSQVVVAGQTRLADGIEVNVIK